MTTVFSVLAGFVHFFRTPETINEVYASYDSLTAEDVRHYANKYFVDSQRGILTLSADESMPGIDGMASVDELVTAAGMAGANEEAVVDSEEIALLVPDVADAVPVSFVANPSPTSPLVDIAFLVHAGAGFDPEGKKGLAALTAALLTDGGSEAKTIEEINDAMYPLASGFRAGCQ